MDITTETVHSSPLVESTSGLVARGLGLAALGALAVYEPTVLKSCMIVGVEGLSFVALTTMYNHRELTHDSLKLGRVLRGVARTAMRALGMNPYVWAATHEVHHSVTDANFIPLIETADYLDYRVQNGITEPPVPELFTNLDPAAALTPEQIRSIGGSARSLVEDKYQPTRSYSEEEVERLLDPLTPRYFYADKKPGFLHRLLRKEEIPTPLKTVDNASLERLSPKLRDPHSPPLHRKGIRGIIKDNPYLYATVAEHFKDNASRPKRLYQDASDRIGSRPGIGKWALIAGNMAITGAVLGGLDAAEFIKYALAGPLLTGGVAMILRGGGNYTNGFGHGGEVPIRSFFTGKILVKPDGTYSSDSRPLSTLTLDEAGNQDTHHNYPWLIAYSVKKGVKKFAEASFGTVLQTLAKHNVGMRPGNGFGLAPGERRPDEASEALVLLQKARVLTLEQNKKQPGFVAA